MNNLEAYTFLKENDSDSLSSLTRKFISQCTVQDQYFDHYRLKFVALLKEREVNRKRQKLEAWNTEIFGPSLEQTLVSSLPKGNRGRSFRICYCQQHMIAGEHRSSSKQSSAKLASKIEKITRHVRMTSS